MSRRYNFWEYYTPSKPIKIEGGIKTKSKRGEIGDTWWSKRWVEVLESFGWSNRLERGKRYARGGQVLDFTIVPGKITAKVQGSVPKPYSVSIELKPFTAKEWNKITDAMAQKAVFAAKLLAGEMPHNIEEAFGGAALSLFPISSKDLKTDCSCPDAANPCKHIAAVHYILAEEFDRDPFMLFKLRGQTQKEITAILRKKRVKHNENNNEQETIPYSEEISQKEKEPFSIHNFWIGKEVDSFSVDLTAPPVPAAILKRLGTPQFWDSKKDFTKLMSEYYNTISTCALEMAKKDDVAKLKGK